MISTKDTVTEAINEAFLLGFDPKNLLSECDLQCLIYSLIKPKLAQLENGDEYSIHTEIPFLNENEKYLIKPDITILKKSEFSLTTDKGKPKSAVNRKAFEGWGSATVIEIKFYKGVAKPKLDKCLADIIKLALIKSLHYSSGEGFEYSPYFVMYSREPIDPVMLTTLGCAAADQGVIFYHNQRN